MSEVSKFAEVTSQMRDLILHTAGNQKIPVVHILTKLGDGCSIEYTGFAQPENHGDTLFKTGGQNGSEVQEWVISNGPQGSIYTRNPLANSSTPLGITTSQSQAINQGPAAISTSQTQNPVQDLSSLQGQNTSEAQTNAPISAAPSSVGIEGQHAYYKWGDWAKANPMRATVANFAASKMMNAEAARSVPEWSQNVTRLSKMMGEDFYTRTSDRSDETWVADFSDAMQDRWETLTGRKLEGVNLNDMGQWVKDMNVDDGSLKSFMMANPYDLPGVLEEFSSVVKDKPSMDTEAAKTATLNSRVGKWGSGYAPPTTQADVGPPPSSYWSSFKSYLNPLNLLNVFKSGPKTIPNPILAPGQTSAPYSSADAYRRAAASFPAPQTDTETVPKTTPSFRKRFTHRLRHPRSGPLTSDSATTAATTATTTAATTAATTGAATGT